MGGSSIAVHSFEFSSQNEIPPEGFKFVGFYNSIFPAVCKAKNPPEMKNFFQFRREVKNPAHGGGKIPAENENGIAFFLKIRYYEWKDTEKGVVR